MGSRAQRFRTGTHALPGLAHGRQLGRRPQTQPPTGPGHGWAPRHRRLPSHEERGVPGIKDVREPHFPARPAGTQPAGQPSSGLGLLPPRQRGRSGCFTPALGRLGLTGFPLWRWHSRMFRKGKCTSRPKWLPHLKPTPVGVPLEPGSPHAHSQVALPLASCRKMPHPFTTLHMHTEGAGTHKRKTEMGPLAKRAWHDAPHRPPGFVVKAPLRPDQRQGPSGHGASRDWVLKSASLPAQGAPVCLV